MPNLKDLRVRIASVKSTQKITSAMKMVAASKLRRAQSSAEEARPYADRMEKMLSELAASLPTLDGAPKLIAGSGAEVNHLLVLVTADRGLCGGFNGSIVRAGKRRIAELEKAGKTVKILCVGRKGRDPLKMEHGKKIIDTLEDTTLAGVQFSTTRDLCIRLRQMFEDGEFDVCTVIYNRFRSAISQEVTVQQLIPFPLPEVVEDDTKSAKADAKVPYIMEPSEEEMLDELLPRNLSVQMFRAMLESFASEQGARMTAMDNATRNAGDIIEDLTLVYNRTRQATITSELIEIISGAEAL